MSSSNENQQDNDLSDDSDKATFWSKLSTKFKKSDNQDKDKPKTLPYYLLFKYSDLKTRIILLISIIFAIGHGVLLPILTVVFGRVIDEFGQLFENEDSPNFVPSDKISETIAETTTIFLILSFVAALLAFVQLFFGLIAANRIGNDLRKRFFNSLIRQQPSFYDDAQAGALTNLVVNDVNVIQAGVGDKLVTAVQYLTTFVAGIAVGFAKGWLLTIVVLSVTPIVLVAGAIFGNASSEASADGLGSYSDAAGLASESLGLVRTVTAFSAHETESRRYDEALDRSYKSAARSAVLSGLGLGVAMFVILCTYGLAFWFGSLRVTAGDMSGGDVLLVFFAITLGASSLGTAGPAFKSFTAARAAAPRVFEIIDAISAIDPLDDSEDSGIVPEGEAKGHISFKDVDFAYPTHRAGDDDTAEASSSPLVLQGFNLDIHEGSSEAFVGKSGSGKSTVARLIQRFYDPVDGSVLLDGVDIRELNVRWLRSQIGVVAQMPSLFAMTIRENIALGTGVTCTKDANTGKIVFTKQSITDEDIIAAAKLANAHDFISKLPEGYDTMLGERGAMLSGGQKQRVCIARALVRNPKILLLDESTASLDTASERIVQEALERAATGRTTITIAHRLSTVRNSDSISCIQNGHVIERGDHDNLMKRDNGFYRNLFELQMIQKAKLEEQMKGDETLDLETEEITVADETLDKTNTEQQTGADSVTKQHDQDSDGKQLPVTDKGLFGRTMKVNKPEWHLIALGTIGAIGSAVVWPVTAFVLVEMIEILVKQPIDKDEVRNWSLGFVYVATLALIGNGLQHGLLGVSGERLTRRLRSQVFKTMLKQEMGYFDMEENSLGALTTRLSNDAGAVKGLTGDLYGIGINVLGSLIAGLAISFSSCWRLSLVVLAIIPGVAIGGYFEMKASAGIDSGAKKEFAKANSVAAEAVDNIATVRSLGAEEHFYNQFISIVNNTATAKIRKDLFTGIAFGFSEFCQYLIWYATFEAGGNFVSAGHCTFREMLLSSMALLFAAITLGNVSVFAPDVGASKLSATTIYRLLDRESKIDPSSDEGMPMTKVEGNVKADNVYFEYPRRPDVRVLRGLSLDVARGKTLAIVGTSGHGKSTIIALLERFYSIRKGAITIDDQDISESRTRDVRSQIGLVSQEPELFNRSIFDNIAYGLPHDGQSVVTQEQVVEAAKLANAHEFITELPDGYDTIVGARGDKLSGGQKQRVAIARSLIRQPPILLLDEATSALDGASELQVQKALDSAGDGRTTLIVAHRLSTIRNADLIVVVRRGRVIESGTHDVLLRRNGAYTKLIESQLTDV